MRGQRRDADPHVREERQPGKEAVEFVVIGDVEDRVVRVLADDPPDLLPPAVALQVLRIGVKPRVS